LRLHSAAGSRRKCTAVAIATAAGSERKCRCGGFYPPAPAAAVRLCLYSDAESEHKCYCCGLTTCCGRDTESTGNLDVAIRAKRKCAAVAIATW